MGRRKTRAALALLDGFVAVTALWGALLVVPQMPASVLRWGPFTDFAVPAIGLGLVGLTAAVGAIGAVVRPPLGAIGSIVAGGAIVVFEVVEAFVVGSLFSPPPGLNDQGYVALWLQPIFATIGLTMMAVAFFGVYRPWQLRWGATDANVSGKLPSQDVVDNPLGVKHPAEPVATRGSIESRAITSESR